MISRLASVIYGAAAARRRQWYDRHPDRVRHLTRPVISVGNVSVGGSGKTPVVAYIARLLLEHGERPAVLSRGYARQHAEAICVVSDGTRVTSDVEHAGDEPFLLASSLAGVRVVVGADRHAAGALAEASLGATVHVLDDGFQHVALARDVDLVIISASDLNDRVLPAGRLREQISVAARADAILADSESEAAVREAFPQSAIFRVTRALDTPRFVEGGSIVDRTQPVFLLAGIARPDRFATDVKAAGWTVAGSRWFRDHHWYTADDRAAIVKESQAAGTRVVFTTEKDAVRLGGSFGGGITVAVVPLSTWIEPAFTPWLLERMPSEKRERPSPRPPGPSPEARGPSPK